MSYMVVSSRFTNRTSDNTLMNAFRTEDSTQKSSRFRVYYRYTDLFRLVKRRTGILCNMNIQRKSVTELFGLPEAPKNGRERLLTVAIDLFYRRGFNAVGIDQVIAAAG